MTSEHIDPSPWKGASGTSYLFNGHKLSMFHKSAGNPELPELPGIYIFTYFEKESGHHLPAYIGETGDLNRRLGEDWNNGKHEARKCIEQYKPSRLYVTAYGVPPEGFPDGILELSQTALDEKDRRLEVEDDLIAAWLPPCNADP